MTPPTKESLNLPNTILATRDDLAVVLVEPRIPQNVGNIARLCVCAGVELFLIGDLGFRFGDKFLERAGMDYLDRAKIHHLPSIEALWEQKVGWTPCYVSTKATKSYVEMSYQPNTLLFFGREDQGLPDWVMQDNVSQSIRIPMVEGVRSLNLSTSTAIVLYEVIRQRALAGA